METNIYLIRHGETEWNRIGRIQGQLDVGLNEEGIMQAKKLSLKFKNIPLSTIYSSDLARARQTAEEIARVCDSLVISCPDLRERYYGTWEGKTYQEIKEQFPGVEVGQVVGGKYGIETFESMQDRAQKMLFTIAESHLGEHVAVVSHGGLINSFIYLISQGTVGTGKTKLLNTSVTHLVYSKNSWEIRSIGDTRHLDIE